MTTVPKSMRASVPVDKQTVEMQERPVPAAAAGEVLVQVRSVGVCGSDVHYYRDRRIGEFVVREPLILGHEVSGVVVDVGADVPETRIGERVAIEPQRPCRRCRHCKTGRYNMCERLEFYATPPVDGAFCGLRRRAGGLRHPVPDALSGSRGGAARTLLRGAVGLLESGGGTGFPRARHRGRPHRGPTYWRRARTARGSGHRPRRVTTRAHPPLRSDGGVRPARSRVRPGGTGGRRLRRVLRAAPALRAGLRALRGRGIAVLVGLGEEETSLPVQLIATRELVLTGVFRYVDTWPKAIAAAQQPGRNSTPWSPPNSTSRTLRPR